MNYKDVKKKYKDVADKVRVLQLPETSISDGVLDALKGRESFIDADKSLNETIYSSIVLSEILDEIEGKEIEVLNKFIPQIKELNILLQGSKFAYLMITRI